MKAIVVMLANASNTFFHKIMVLGFLVVMVCSKRENRRFGNHRLHPTGIRKNMKNIGPMGSPGFKGK